MQKRSEFADLAVSNVAATFRQCLSLIRKQAIDTGLKRNLGKTSWRNIQKISYGFLGFRRFTLEGGGWQRSVDWLQKTYKHWTENSRKRDSRPKVNKSSNY